MFTFEVHSALEGTWQRLTRFSLWPCLILLVGCGSLGDDAPTLAPKPTTALVATTTFQSVQRSLPPLQEPKTVNLEVISLQQARQDYLEEGCLGCVGVLGELNPESLVVILDLNGDALRDAFVIQPKTLEIYPFVFYLLHTGVTLERVKDPKGNPGHFLITESIKELTAYEMNSKGQLALIIEYTTSHPMDRVGVFNGATERHWDLDSNFWGDNVASCCDPRGLQRHILANVDDDEEWELLLIDLKKPVYVFQLGDTGSGVSHEPDLERKISLAIGDYISAANQNEAELAGQYWDLHGPRVSLAALAIAHGLAIGDFHRTLTDMLDSNIQMEQAIIDSIDMQTVERYWR